MLKNMLPSANIPLNIVIFDGQNKISIVTRQMNLDIFEEDKDIKNFVIL